MSAAPEPVGTLEVALAHATRLLATNPVMAAEQAAEIFGGGANAFSPYENGRPGRLSRS